MTKEALRQMLEAATAGKPVMKVPTGRRGHSEKEMYLLTEATDREVQEARIEAALTDEQAYREYERQQQEAWAARFA